MCAHVRTHTHAHSLLPLPGPASPVGHSRDLACGVRARWQEHCRVDRPQAAEQARGTPLFPNGGNTLPLAPSLPGSASKRRRKATLQPASPSPHPSISPFSSHPPQGAAPFPSQGPIERREQTEAAQLSVHSPHKVISKARLCGRCWGSSKSRMAPQPPERFPVSPSAPLPTLPRI